jgi:polysaccharide export outer membrane protein
MIVRFVPVMAISLLMTSVASAQDGAPAPADAPAAAPTTGNASPTPVVSSTAAVTVNRAAADTSRDYRIGAEDVLEIWVFDQKDLSRTVPVRPDGKISMPFVNDVVAAGRTTAELRAFLTEGLTPYVQNPEVSVMVKEVNSRKVSVQGDVRMPGVYDIGSDATVLSMISRAQGIGDYGNKADIRVIRKDKVIKFNYNRVVDGKDPDIAVQPGDIVYVAR